MKVYNKLNVNGIRKTMGWTDSVKEMRHFKNHTDKKKSQGYTFS